MNHREFEQILDQVRNLSNAEGIFYNAHIPELSIHHRELHGIATKINVLVKDACHIIDEDKKRLSMECDRIYEDIRRDCKTWL